MRLIAAALLIATLSAPVLACPSGERVAEEPPPPVVTSALPATAVVG
ncbi:MAG: hypothetical protein RML45_14370 [Acetobacteraceae bacterium]|nr:hypothetical protein [Acetobacteraceae bacterium]